MRADGRPPRRRPDGVIRCHPVAVTMVGCSFASRTAEALGVDVVDASLSWSGLPNTVLYGTLIDRADLDRVLRTLRRLRAKVVSVDVAP